MTEEKQKKINKLIIPFPKRTLSFLTATIMLVTGTVGCKDDDKEKEDTSTTTSISQNVVTSSDEELVVSNNSSSVITEESTVEHTKDTTTSSSSTTSTSSTNKTSQESSSTSDNKTSEVSSSSSSKNNSSSSKTNSTSSKNNSSSVSSKILSTSSTTQTMPSKLTAKNINDIETFKHFAKMFRKELDGDLLRFNGRMTDGEQEFQLMLALMNYEYINDDIMYELFHNVSLTEMQELAYFVNALISTTVNQNEYYNYNKYFIDKKFSNFMMSIQSNIPSKNQENLVNIFRGFYLETNNKVKFNDHFWVDRYVCQMFPLIIDMIALNDDPLITAYVDSMEAINTYQEKITEIYNKMSIKTKVKE